MIFSCAEVFMQKYQTSREKSRKELVHLVLTS